jgi:SAM-dependent methyltransferase
MKLEQIKSALRHVDAAHYPELVDYSRDDAYDKKMGPGGLYLAARMTREMGLKKDDKVLDVGCGRGTTSIFLAKQFGVCVTALDLWVSAEKLQKRFEKADCSDSVKVINLDVTKELPFAEGEFDAIFCMDSIHYYGGNAGFMRHLLPHIRPGGVFCIGSPCFNREFTEEELRTLPKEYDDGTNLWPEEFSKYHSPKWWASLLEDSGLVEQIRSDELNDGTILWEDDLLYNIEKLNWSEEKAAVDFSQISYRSGNYPYLTHFVLSCRKIPAKS